MFSQNASQVIQEVCKPHKGISLVNFLHNITFDKGQISMIVRDHNVASHYQKNKIPIWCTNDSGRTLAEGVYLNKTLESTHRDCAILMPQLRKIGVKYNQNYGKNAIHIITREHNCQHLYALFFDLDENEFLQWVINNGDLLQNFIHEYRMRSNDLILEAKSCDNRMVLPTTSEFVQATNSVENNTNIVQLTLIHKTLQLPIHLPSQQSRCLLHLSQGKSAKEIALELDISPRTVEYYFDMTRKQLGSASNKKLIADYGDQLNFI